MTLLLHFNLKTDRIVEKRYTGRQTGTLAKIALRRASGSMKAIKEDGQLLFGNMPSLAPILLQP